MYVGVFVLLFGFVIESVLNFSILLYSSQKAKRTVRISGRVVLCSKPKEKKNLVVRSTKIGIINTKKRST